MGLISIGAVSLGEFGHGNPTYSFGSSSSGMAPVTIGGVMPWPQAKVLLELVNNRAMFITRGEFEGIPEFFEFTGTLLASFTGWYLLTDFRLDPSKAHTMSADTAPFTLTAALVGDAL